VNGSSASSDDSTLIREFLEKISPVKHYNSLARALRWRDTLHPVGGMMASGITAVGVRLPVYLLRLGLASASGATARFYSTVPESKQKYVPSGGTYPKGFKVSGVHAGVKPSNTTKPDLALLVADTGDQEYQCTAHAVFTTARYVAAPVVYTKEALSRTSTTHGVQAVIINSGCANAITGQGGMEDAAKMAQVTKEVVTGGGRSQHDGETLVMSTGVIGQR
jgi:glutamate N-acetyltransferase / amino-acid N-acetyltransferase